MGYTHYWYRPREIPAPEFAAWVEDCKRIVAACAALPKPVKLLEEYDQPGTRPTLGPELVRFNGYNEYGHETFYVERVIDEETLIHTFPMQGMEGLHFQFCKTQGKPYDIAVVACIYALKLRVPAVKISSDGSLSAGSLEPGMRLAESVMRDDEVGLVVAARLDEQVWG